MNDTTVQCKECGNEKAVVFEECLVNGWPKCCGYTMMTKETKTDIGKAINNKVGKPFKTFLDSMEKHFKEQDENSKGK